jgi:hypothetical protein
MIKGAHFFLIFCLVSICVAVKCTNYDTPNCPCDNVGQFCRVIVPEGSPEDTCIPRFQATSGSAKVTCNKDGTWSATYWVLVDDCPTSLAGAATYNGNGTQCTAPTKAASGAGNWICECPNQSGATTLLRHGFHGIMVALLLLVIL